MLQQRHNGFNSKIPASVFFLFVRGRLRRGKNVLNKLFLIKAFILCGLYETPEKFEVRSIKSTLTFGMF